MRIQGSPALLAPQRPLARPAAGAKSPVLVPAAASASAPAATPPAPKRGWRESLGGFFEGLKDKMGEALLGGYHAVGGLLDSFERFSPDRASRPTEGNRLKIASYNVMLGGKDYPGILATLRKANPDVAGLQEVSRENAERLGRELGMHVAFYGESKGPFDSPVGKAILSKHPLASAKHDTFLSTDAHWDALQRYAKAKDKPIRDAVFHTELSSLRGSLEATFTAGGRKFAVLDTHLTLNDPQLNAAQLAILREKAAAYEAKGYQVVMMGDFNTNLALSNGASTPGAAFSDETDTVAEWKARYGKGSAGNVGDAANMRAADALRQELKPAWEAAVKRYSVTTHDAEMTPDEARALLAKGDVAKGSPEWKVLAAAADGITHLGADKRFDNILVSEGLEVREAAIDMTSKASDHQIVTAEVSW